MTNLNITNAAASTPSPNSKYTQIHNRIDGVENDLNKKIEGAQISFLTAFGILASMITFLSIEIQILKSICSIERSIGITFIILGGLLLFCLLIRSLLHSKIDFRNDIIFWIVSICSIILLLSGIGFTVKNNQSEYRCVEKELNSKFEKLKLNTKNDIEEIKNNLLSGYNI